MKTQSAATFIAVSILWLGLDASARAQSLNIKFGTPGQGPSPTYAAAGLAGVWNTVQAQQSPQVTYHLVGLDGLPTSVTLSQTGGALETRTDPSVSGDDAALLNDALITYNPGLESCLFINGLQPGTYEVTMYAWMPSHPTVFSRVRQDLSTRTEDVGGAWPGMHVEGVTYARHILVIGSSGYLGSHSGIVPGAVAANGAALNGVQIRLIPPGMDASVPADTGMSGSQDSGPPPMDAEVDAGASSADATGANDAAAAHDAAGAHDAGAAHDASVAGDTGAGSGADAGVATDASPQIDAGAAPDAHAAADASPATHDAGADLDATGAAADAGAPAHHDGCRCVLGRDRSAAGPTLLVALALAALTLATARPKRLTDVVNVNSSERAQ